MSRSHLLPCSIRISATRRYAPRSELSATGRRLHSSLALACDGRAGESQPASRLLSLGGPARHASGVSRPRHLPLAELGRHPRFLGCGVQVHPYGSRATHGPKRSDHPDLPVQQDVLDDCLLARRDPRFTIFDHAELHAAAGARLRERFFDEANVKVAYNLCLQACGPASFSTADFRGLVDRADRKKVWSLAGANLLAMRFVILSLENFHPRFGADFHFVLSRGRARRAVARWSGVRSAVLRKVRSDDGACHGGRFEQVEVGEDELRSIAGDVTWMRIQTARALAAVRSGVGRRLSPGAP